MITKGKISTKIISLIFSLTMLLSLGCAHRSNGIAIGMLSGALVGAAVGHQFVHHGENRQYESENTAITSVLFALITGGVILWHNRALEELKVEISGDYSRYKLCDPATMQKEFESQNTIDSKVYSINSKHVGKLAIFLDDNTKWIYPTFRKRYLNPENEETQVLSKRYLWEIIKSGSFVTRTMNPEYFLQQEDTVSDEETNIKNSEKDLKE